MIFLWSDPMQQPFWQTLLHLPLKRNWPSSPPLTMAERLNVPMTAVFHKYSAPVCDSILKCVISQGSRVFAKGHKTDLWSCMESLGARLKNRLGQGKSGVKWNRMQCRTISELQTISQNSTMAELARRVSKRRQRNSKHWQQGELHIW